MTGFVRESPLVTARRYADREIKDRAKPAEVQWLHDHPVWWLRALCQIERDVNTSIGLDRIGLAAARPRPGQPQEAYKALKAQTDARITGKIFFLRKAQARKEEVESLFGTRLRTPGEVVSGMQTVEMLLAEDDIEAARDALEFWIKKIGDEHHV